MAEFSQEYQDAIGSPYPGDFIIMDSFKRLMEGMSIGLICEGLGSVGIKKEDGCCFLLYLDKNPVLLEDAVNSLA